MKEGAIDQILLNVEELDQRIAPGLTTDLCGVDLTSPILTSSDCPTTTTTTDCGGTTDTGGNNGYGNGGFDGVPGDSSSNPSPTSGEKAADIVR